MITTIPTVFITALCLIANIPDVHAPSLYCNAINLPLLQAESIQTVVNRHKSAFKNFFSMQRNHSVG